MSEEWKDTNEQIFEKTYKEQYLHMLYYVQNKINNIHDAEDIVCDAFTYCYKHLSDYDSSKASMVTWLYLIINSRIKNYYRDRKDYVELGELENSLYSEDVCLENAVLLEEQCKIIKKAIKSLPERQQQIVILKYFQNKSSPEIASILQISPGNVRVLLMRALQKLEQYYNLYMK